MSHRYIDAWDLRSLPTNVKERIGSFVIGKKEEDSLNQLRMVIREKLLQQTVESLFYEADRRGLPRVKKILIEQYGYDPYSQ